ncbi:hypothetical protein NTCA1_38290 [Novosphingobium sp. TCA1]|nr:hypothetical protein NTCA1_38290 [Novosphingobium sp. TCA1]
MEACPERGTGRAPAPDRLSPPDEKSIPCIDGPRMNDAGAPSSTRPILRSVARVFAMIRAEDRVLQEFNGTVPQASPMQALRIAGAVRSGMLDRPKPAALGWIDIQSRWSREA